MDQDIDNIYLTQGLFTATLRAIVVAGLQQEGYRGQVNTLYRAFKSSIDLSRPHCSL